jgi:hypothetical protein
VPAFFDERVPAATVLAVVSTAARALLGLFQLALAAGAPLGRFG